MELAVAWLLAATIGGFVLWVFITLMLGSIGVAANNATLTAMAFIMSSLCAAIWTSYCISKFFIQIASIVG